jgi:hypothetical protein
MKDSKNQIIRSMKSYAVGGSSDDSCMEEYMDASGMKKKRKKRGGCKQTFGRRSIPEGVKKAAKVIGVVGGGALAYAKNAFGVKDKVKELMGQKKGGAVKMQKGGVAKGPTLSARVKPVVKAVKTVKATVKRRG